MAHSNRGTEESLVRCAQGYGIPVKDVEHPLLKM